MRRLSAGYILTATAVILIAQQVFESWILAAFNRERRLCQSALRRLRGVLVVAMPTIEVRIEVMLLAVNQLAASRAPRLVRRGWHLYRPAPCDEAVERISNSRTRTT